jgi:hypothetical protein
MAEENLSLLKRKSSGEYGKGKELKRDQSFEKAVLAEMDDDILAEFGDDDMSEGASSAARVSRPPLKPINADKESIVFQQLELEQYTTTEHLKDMPGHFKESNIPDINLLFDVLNLLLVCLFFFFFS